MPFSCLERSLRIADPVARTSYLVSATRASLTAQERILDIPAGSLNAGTAEALEQVSAKHFGPQKRAQRDENKQTRLNGKDPS